MTIIRRITNDILGMKELKNTNQLHFVAIYQVLSELEEIELKEEMERLARDNKNEEDNQFALDIVRPGNKF